MIQQKEQVDQISQIQEDVDLELNVNQLKKILVDIIDEEHGIDNERAWKVSCAISIHYSKIALMHLKLNDLQNCELFLKKSKQFTEPAYGDQKWKQYEEWYFQRISISIHFAIIYKKQKKFDILCEVLKQQIKEVEVSNKCESIMKNIESKFETVYFQLSEICFHIKQFDETITYCLKTIDCIEQFEQLKNGDNNLLKKKIIMKTHSFYIIGLSYFTKEKWQESLKYYKKAYLLGEQTLGENNQNVLKYKKNFEQLKQQIQFEDQINQSLNFAQIDKEIDYLKKQEKEESHIFTDKSVASQSSHQQQKKIEQQEIQQQAQKYQPQQEQKKQIQPSKSQISSRPFSAVTQLQQLHQKQFIIQKKDLKINSNIQIIQPKQLKNVQSAKDLNAPIRKQYIQKQKNSVLEHSKRINKANNFRIDMSDPNLKLSYIKEQQIQSQKFPIANNNRPYSSISQKIGLPQLDIPIDSSQFMYPNTGFYSTNFAQTSKNQLPIFSVQNIKKTFGQELQKLLDDDESFQIQQKQRRQIEPKSLNNLMMQRPQDKFQQNQINKKKDSPDIKRDKGYIINFVSSSPLKKKQTKLYQQQNQKEKTITQQSRQSEIPSISYRQQSSMHSSQFNDLEGEMAGHESSDRSQRNNLQTIKPNISRRSSYQQPVKLDIELIQASKQRKPSAFLEPSTNQRKPSIFLQHSPKQRKSSVFLELSPKQRKPSVFQQSQQRKPSVFLEPSPYSYVQSRRSSKQSNRSSKQSDRSRSPAQKQKDGKSQKLIKSPSSSQISEKQNIKQSQRKSELNSLSQSNQSKSQLSVKEEPKPKIPLNKSDSQFSNSSGTVMTPLSDALKLKYTKMVQAKFRRSTYGVKGMLIKHVFDVDDKQLIEKMDLSHLDSLHPFLKKQKNIQAYMKKHPSVIRSQQNSQIQTSRRQSKQEEDQEDQLELQIKNQQKYKITQVMEVCNQQDDKKKFIFYSTKYKDQWDMYTFTDVKFQFYFHKIDQSSDFKRELRINFNMMSKLTCGIFTINLSGVSDLVLDFNKKNMQISDKWQLADYLVSEFLEIQDYFNDFEKVKKKSKDSFQLISKSKDIIQDKDVQQYQLDLFRKLNFLIIHHSKLSESFTSNQQFIVLQDIYNDEGYINLLDDQLNNKYLNYQENMKERTQVSKERSAIKRSLSTKITVMQPQVLTKIGYQKWKKNPDYSKDYEVFYKQFNFIPNTEIFQKQKKLKNLPQDDIKPIKDQDQLEMINQKNKVNFPSSSLQTMRQQSQMKQSKIAKQPIKSELNLNADPNDLEYLPRTPVARPQGKVKNSLNIQYFEYNQSQLFKEVPEVLVNPFYLSQTLFKSLIKVKGRGLEDKIFYTYALLQFRIYFTDKSLYICDDPLDLSIKIKPYRFSANLRTIPDYEIKFQEFLNLTIKNGFKFNQFLYDGKFNNKQKQIIASIINKLVGIHTDGFESRLIIQSDDSKDDIDPLYALSRVLNIDKQINTTQQLQNILQNPMDEQQPMRSSVNDIKILEQIVKQQLPQDLYQIIFNVTLDGENFQVYTQQKYEMIMEKRKELQETPQINMPQQLNFLNILKCTKIFKSYSNKSISANKSNQKKIILNLDAKDQQKYHELVQEKPIDHKNKKSEDLMEYYNSYQSISKLKYILYRINCFNDGFKKKIKIYFKINSESKLQSEIVIFDPLGYKIDRITITTDFDIEKLINLIQIISEPIKQRLMLMSLTSQKRLIGRKLIFKSYVEKNQELFNFQFNRKFNKNDNNLYKMLTISGYLSDKYMNQNKFLYKIKLALISSDINSQLSEQNFFLSTYFHTRRVRQFSRIQNLGTALIQTVVYMTNLLYTDNEYIFIRLDVSFVKSKTKSLKFIMDVTDIQELIMPEFCRKNCMDNQTVQNMVILLCQKLVYFDRSTYSGLKIPMSLISSQSNQKNENMHKYDLLNSFSYDFLLDYNKQAKSSMLTSVLRSIKVIYQAIKKIGSNYVVISVRRIKMDEIDQFLLLIYVPKVTRQFLCFMSPLDFLQFEPAFMEQLFPYIFWQKSQILKELEDPKEQYKIYEHFSNKYNNYVRDPEKAIQEKEEIQKQAFIQPTSLLRKGSSKESQLSKSRLLLKKTSMSDTQSLKTFKKSSTLLQNDIEKKFKGLEIKFQKSSSIIEDNYKTNSKAFMRLFSESQLVSTQFLELIIWEKLVNLMEIYLNDNQNFILKINTFHGILRELLHMEVINLNANNNCHFEAYIQKRSKVPSDPNLVDLNYMKNAESLFDPFNCIQIHQAFCYSIYIRIKFFERPSQSNDKLVLRHILYTYFKSEPGKLKNKNPELQKKNQLSQKNLNIDKNKEDSGGEEENVFICEYQDYQFIQADLQQMAIYCANKIRTSYLINKPGELFKEIGNLNTAQQRVLSMRKANLIQIDNKCPSLLKINFKTYKNLLDNIDKRYLLFFRGVFTTKPMQMITISYKPLNSKFYILIWNTNNSKKILKKFTLYEIQNTIPYILDMFKLQQYEQIGKRIYMAYKNKLMLNTFTYLNPPIIDNSKVEISF